LDLSYRSLDSRVHLLPYERRREDHHLHFRESHKDNHSDFLGV